MIQRIIEFSVKNKLVIGLFILAWTGWGIYSMMNLPLNSVPDLTNNQVKVTTYTPDLATEEVERLITYPIELEMGNLPGLIEIRSVSNFGLSDITLVFDERMGMYKPRQLVKEKLISAAGKLPVGVGEPSMGPMTSGLGEVYQYVLTPGPGYDTLYDAMDLREIQDWIVKKELINIPGVVGVNTMGGYLKQYEVAVDPVRLRSYNITISDIYEVLRKNNANTGGSYIEKNRQAYFIRGEGLITSLEDIRNIVIHDEGGTPLRIGDVARVGFGSAPRFGAFTYNGNGEAVGGKIMMLRGENPAGVIKDVKERLTRVREALPEGVQLEPFLDRSSLIAETTHTVVENLALGALIVIFVLVFLMGNFRSGLITASVIPLSLLFALGIMYTFDFSANLISLGAVDFGIIIDGAVIIVEFVVFQLSRNMVSLKNSRGRELQARMDEITIRASGRMMRTAIFGQLIILIVFIPILALTGQEGKMFRPMAITFGSALIGAIILCLTYVPMMTAWIVRPDKRDAPKPADRILGWVRRGYRKLLGSALRYRYAVTSGILLLFIAALFIFFRMGAVFIPTLDEGDFAIHPILQPGTSLEETVRINTSLEQVLLEEFPDEVEQVATKIGTGEIPTDPMSLEMAKMIINLAPRNAWTRAQTKDELEALMKAEMSSAVPGVNFFFSQPVEMLFNHLLTGSSADLLVNIYGDHLDTLFRIGNEAGEIIRRIPGAGDLNVQKVIGLPQIVIRYDRDILARYGLDIDQVNRAIQAGYSGAVAGTIYEGERQFSQVVRLDEKYRKDPDAVGELYLKRPNGRQVKLSEVATITMQDGPAAISREGVRRKLEVDVNIGDRDTESFVEEVQKQLEEKLDLPRGYYLTYEGEYENLQSAKKRLRWVVPLVLGFIFILLYMLFGSLKQAILVFSAVPLAAIGGVFSLWLRGMPFSISAAVGFIALFGIAVLNGVVLMSFFNELKGEGMSNVYRRIYHGTDLRLRPVILTALTDALGFLPMALSTSPGAEVQRPLATVVVGGLITATLLTLVLLPIIYTFSEKKIRVPSLAKVVSKTGNMERKNNRSWIILVLLSLGTLAPSVRGQIPAPGGRPFQDEGRTVRNAQVAVRIYTMEEAVQAALENHPAVKAADLGVLQQQWLKTAAWDLPDTELSFEKENEGAGLHRWSVEQSMQNPLEYVAMDKLAAYRIRREEDRLNLVRSAITRNVKTAYIEVLYARQKLGLMQQLEQIFSGLDRAGKTRYNTGDISFLEQVSTSAKYRQITMERERAKTLLDNRQKLLEMSMFAEGPVRIADTTITARSLQEDLSPADSAGGNPDLSGNPDLAVSRSTWETSRVVNRAVRFSLWPDPFFRYRYTAFNQIGNFSSFELGLRIPIDIRAERGKNRSAEIAAEMDYQQYLRLEKEVSTDIVTVRNELEHYWRQLDYYRDNRLREADMIVKSALRQYEAGNIGYLQYVQYFDQSTTIRIDYLDVLLEYNRKLVELEYLLGM